MLLKKIDYIQVFIMKHIKKKEQTYNSIKEKLLDSNLFTFFTPTENEIKKSCEVLKEKELIVYEDESIQDTTHITLFKD